MLRDDPNPPRGTLPTRGAFRAAAVRSGGPTYRTTMGIRGPSSRREEGRRSQRRRRGPRADYRRCGRAAHDPRDGDDHLPRPPGDSVATGVACRCLHPAHVRPHESGPVDRLRGADEVFLSGSGVGVLSITSVDGRRMEAPGPATRTIQDGYATMLDAETKW